MPPWKPHEPARRPDPGEWEHRAVRIAATLDHAADELTKLIEDIRKSRTEEGDPADD